MDNLLVALRVLHWAACSVAMTVDNLVTHLAVKTAGRKAVYLAACLGLYSADLRASVRVALRDVRRAE